MWARVGTPICPNDGHQITSQSPQQIVDQILALPERSKIQILAPVVQDKKGQHKEVLKKIQRAGFVRVIIDGEMHEIGDEIELDKNKKTFDFSCCWPNHCQGWNPVTAFDSVEAALKLTDGYVAVDVIGDQVLQFSEKLACPYCGFSIKELEPRLFSFNAPFGACPECDGLGEKLKLTLI